MIRMKVCLTHEFFLHEKLADFLSKDEIHDKRYQKINNAFKKW